MTRNKLLGNHGVWCWVGSVGELLTRSWQPLLRGWLQFSFFFFFFFFLNQAHGWIPCGWFMTQSAFRQRETQTEWKRGRRKERERERERPKKCLQLRPEVDEMLKILTTFWGCPEIGSVGYRLQHSISAAEGSEQESGTGCSLQPKCSNFMLTCTLLNLWQADTHWIHQSKKATF